MRNGRDALKYRIANPPASEPVTRAEIKAQMRIDESDDSYDELIDSMIPVARDWCENYQNRTYITQTLELTLDDWPYRDEIRLPKPPVQSVSTLTYTGTSGAVTTVSPTEYVLDNYSEPGFLVARNCWPTDCLDVTNAVKVAYVAGYGTASQVPARIRQAIILLAAHWADNGMCDPPCAVKSLLDLDRVVPL